MITYIRYWFGRHLIRFGLWLWPDGKEKTDVQGLLRHGLLRLWLKNVEKVVSDKPYDEAEAEQQYDETNGIYVSEGIGYVKAYTAADGTKYGYLPVSLDDDEEVNRDPDFEDDKERDEDGCVFPGECCMPGPHMKSECHTAEMLIQQEYEALIDDYKEYVKMLKDCLATVKEELFDFNPLSIQRRVEEALEKSKHMRERLFPHVTPNLEGERYVSQLGQNSELGRDKRPEADAANF